MRQDVQAAIYPSDEWVLEKLENHAATRYFMYYNFTRVHQPLRG